MIELLIVVGIIAAIAHARCEFNRGYRLGIDHLLQEIKYRSKQARSEGIDRDNLIAEAAASELRDEV